MTKTTTEQQLSELVEGHVDDSSLGPGREYPSSPSKASESQAHDGSSRRRKSFLVGKGKQTQEMLDSDSDSDPEKPMVMRQVAAEHQQNPTKEQDRERLLNELGQSSWKTLEQYKAANAERIKRCYMADERDQNRNILHWLSVHLRSNRTDRETEHLHWLVSTVIELEAKIVTMIPTDSQKANCLQTAIEHERFDLIDSLSRMSDDESLRVAISHGNHYKETCLHLAVRLGSQSVGSVMQLLKKADPKTILKQRDYRLVDDKPNHRNTVLHDFVHIEFFSVQGYMKTLRRFIQLCPEVLKVSNAAKESPFQFHLATRDKKHPEWQGLEFSSPNEEFETTKEKAAKVGRLLLDKALSQPSWEDACSSLYGEKNFDQATTTFRPAAPIDKRIDRSHEFLKFYPILSYVELVLAQPVVHNLQDVRHDTSLHLSGDHIDVCVADRWAERTESIKRVFAWFRKQKVKRILNLVVVDDTALPCSDTVIEDCLRDFDVRYLRWTKDDLCVEVLRNAGLSSIKELWLHWSGRNSVLYSWSCKDTGLPKLPKLEMVHIHTRASVESSKSNEKNLESFNERLKTSVDSVQIDDYQKDLTERVTKALNDYLTPLGTKLQKSMLTWNGEPDYVQIAKVGEGEPPPTIEATIAGFKARATFDRKKTKGARVIRVDDKSRETLNKGNVSQQGARQDQKGHRWLDAVKRLKTAINIHQQNNQLKSPESSRMAANADILLFCAVQDSGHYENDELSFPQKSDTKKLIIVGSANENGDKSTFFNENSFNYLFPGEIVIPDILTKDDQGSSVATAVAAGMAAMILWCAEYHDKCQRSRGSKILPKAPATTISPNLDILEQFETGLRTTPEWDFRRDGRMSALFDALKPDNDKFVDITSTINAVMASVDEFQETDAENQKSCIEAFILICKGNLPLNRR